MDKHGSVTPEQPQLSQEAKLWAMVTHFAAFAAFLIPFGNIIGPVVAWQLKKDFHPFVAQNGKEAVNFQITIGIAAFIGIMLIFVGIGVFVLPVLGVYWIAMTIIGGVKANNGVAYRYPMTLRFIK
ncbi:DUF4870 domain-containing protein [Pseudomonas sp. C27(2019)]|uniref:DUF4870 domain-containing protein n=1 Tax=Pseudomonas sp. C27(2019) TaxID=2604941 RepID=UPI001246B457|nr:DUF4870 domain-containing protein [Pseudomonas sp. C27(2019)]QEY59866.1 DUF4870 domain-containing protein [Pseudomonas sp. C27(2019)]